ncbi:hypothetical protein E2C01_094107 [Portunus trituberculatus]|uniref:Uncharacterized protein n=1 Tax=Portunus trituberculatus TaxID=210409 RepID=A0A5B7JWQ7_PORTR|nr:hypothetical protein [Portunus trituberculatus]
MLKSFFAASPQLPEDSSTMYFNGSTDKLTPFTQYNLKEDSWDPRKSLWPLGIVVMEREKSTACVDLQILLRARGGEDEFEDL